MTSVVVVGAGLGGLAAAVTAAAEGARVALVERGEKFGGAAAYSGGQVWVGANHVARCEGSDDTIAATKEYVTALAMKEPSVFEPARMDEWIEEGQRAAKWFEDHDAVRWTVIPGYPDYYHPDVPGSRPWGRYLTGALFDGHALGGWRASLLEGPHFPVGITYAEQFELGGMSRRDALAALRAERVAADLMSYGQGIVASFGAAARRAGVELLLGTEVTHLLHDDHGVTGVRVRDAGGERELHGAVILATGSPDWNPEIAKRVTGLDPDDSGSVAPPTLRGDQFRFAEEVDAAIGTIPAWAAPVLPGYRLPEPAFPGDTGFRPCWEHSVPHTFIVNRAGERFCDDSFHPRIVAAALDDSGGDRVNIPMFMIWDEQHHEKYGLGNGGPGGPYPEGLVHSAPTLEALAASLGIDPDGLGRTATNFNGPARMGQDPAFGRGSNASARRFRGDNTAPHPNNGPVERPPFFGMRLRLCNTGIASSGLRSTDHARVLDRHGEVIDGLYAVGECAVRNTGGGGYNSGYSLSRAMVFGWVAARHALGIEHRGD